MRALPLFDEARTGWGRWSASLSVAVDFSCAITPRGDAYGWGGNSLGMLGDGSRVNQSRPVPVSGGVPFRMLTSRDSHTCGLTTDNAVCCWGFNQIGQLGDGSRGLSW